MRHAARAHVDELIKAAHGGDSGRDPLIHQSWRRCLDDYRLDPVAPRRAYIHTQQRLREHREAMDDLIRVARFGVESLYRQVSGLGYVLILSDAEGVAVDFIGEPSQDEALRRAGLYRGSDWSEPLAGTCAVGTCITTGTALTVHQDDHFSGDHIALTCTAAPIFSTDGHLAAVLDISALRSPSPKASQHLALQLATSFAHRIETANLHNRFRRDWIVQLSPSQAFADIEPDLVVAVDATGRIIGANSRARRVIAAASPPSQDLRVGKDLAPPPGPRFDEVFAATVDDLPDLTRDRPVERRVLRLRRDDTPYFALALRPPVAARPPAASRGTAERRPPAPAAALGVAATLSGGDPVMDEVASRAPRLVEAGLSLLLQGETGTGKEFVAKTLHRASSRGAKPFVAVNCGALPETLLEAELFGYEPGAFTGAAPKGKRGLVEQAQHGTLFLDEIGDMPLLAQTRLLRVLSEREIMPVGATKVRSVDVRVIAATHRDLQGLVREGRFREDLYYRLSGATLALPPLRHRRDFDWLVDRLLEGQADRPCRLSTEARASLAHHHWPGNIRELAHALDYAAAVASGETIQGGDLPAAVRGMAETAPETGGEAAEASLDEVSLREVSLREVLRGRGWNVSAAARDLGVDRSTIHRRMRKCGLTPPNRRG